MGRGTVRSTVEGPPRSGASRAAPLRQPPAAPATSPFLRNGEDLGTCPPRRRWRILVEGDERAVPRDSGERKGLDHLAARLLNGEAVAPEALEYYGITVRYLGDGV